MAAKPPPIVPGDPLFNAAVASLERLSNENPYVCHLVLGQLATCAIRAADDVHQELSDGTPLGRVFQGLSLLSARYKQRHLAKLQSIADAAWRAGKGVLIEDEQIEGHLLMSQVFSAAFADNVMADVLEVWSARRPAVCKRARSTRLARDSRRRFMTAILEVPELSETRRLSSIFRAVMVASDAQVVSLIEKISVYPRLITPAF